MQHCQSLVSMRAVRPLLQAVVAAGVARDAFLRAAQLDSSFDQAADARVPRAKLFQLFELAITLTGDRAFGLHSVEGLTTEAVSPLGALIAHSATLGEALRSLQEFRGMFGGESTFQIEHKAGKVYVRFRNQPDASRLAQQYLSEVAMTGLYLLLRRFASSPVDHVAFAYPAPEHHAEYARVFEARARFDQAFTGMAFDAELLNAPAPHVDAELHAALSAFARRRVRQLTAGRTWTERVHEQLVWQSPPRDMSMRSVARKLGLSTRTLRRHLAAERKPYGAIVTEALTVIAKSCLLDEQRTIMETAHELGFSDNTSFHRAFKRWTGMTPTAFRRAQTVSSADRTGVFLSTDPMPKPKGGLELTASQAK